MKFLLDVNVGGNITQWLNTQGYDVVQVSEVNPRMIDQKILSWANREKRIIITTDNDFEQMIWLQKNFIAES